MSDPDPEPQVGTYFPTDGPKARYPARETPEATARGKARARTFMASLSPRLQRIFGLVRDGSYINGASPLNDAERTELGDWAKDTMRRDGIEE